MPNTLLRQRRRIAAALLFAQIAVYVVWPDPVAAATVALATVFASVAIIQTASSQRRWIECGGLGAVIAVLLPDALMAPALFFAPVLVCFVLYGPVLDRTTLRFTLISTRKMIAPQPIPEAWSAVVPGEGHPSAHWSGKLIDFGRDDDDDDTIYLRFRADDVIYDEMIVTILDADYPSRAKYAQEASGEAEGQDMTVQLDLTGLEGDRTEIRSETLIEDLPLRQALSLWFDDAYGDEFDGYAETIRSRRRWRIQRGGSGTAAREAGAEAA